MLQRVAYTKLFIGALPSSAGTSSYPATLFTDAPLAALQQAIAAVGAGCAPSLQLPPPPPLLCLRDFAYGTANGWLCAAGLDLQVGYILKIFPILQNVLTAANSKPDGPGDDSAELLRRCVRTTMSWQG